MSNWETQDSASDAVVQGMAYRGAITTATSTTSFASTDLKGFGDDYFVGWYLQYVWDAGGAGAAPQGDVAEITDYTSSTGTFTISAPLTAAPALTDIILVINPILIPSGSQNIGGGGGGVGNTGIVTTATSTTVFRVQSLANRGDDFFVGQWAIVLWDAGGANAAPQGEIRQITDYTSSTGEFTVSPAFSVAPALNDVIGISLDYPTTSSSSGSGEIQGTISTYTGPTQWTCSDLTGYQNNYFYNWSMVIIWDTAGAGNFPQAERRRVTSSTSAGVFTVASAYSTNPAVGDYVILRPPDYEAYQLSTNLSNRTDTITDVTGNVYYNLLIAANTHNNLAPYGSPDDSTLTTVTPATFDGLWDAGAWCEIDVYLDLSTLQAGDTLEVTFARSVNGSVNHRILNQITYSGAQSTTLVHFTLTCTSDNSLLCYFRQTAGVGRTIVREVTARGGLLPLPVAAGG